MQRFQKNIWFGVGLERFRHQTKYFSENTRRQTKYIASQPTSNQIFVRHLGTRLYQCSGIWEASEKSQNILHCKISLKISDLTENSKNREIVYSPEKVCTYQMWLKSSRWLFISPGATCLLPKSKNVTFCVFCFTC